MNPEPAQPNPAQPAQQANGAYLWIGLTDHTVFLLKGEGEEAILLEDATPDVIRGRKVIIAPSAAKPGHETYAERKIRGMGPQELGIVTSDLLENAGVLDTSGYIETNKDNGTKPKLPLLGALILEKARPTAPASVVSSVLSVDDPTSWGEPQTIESELYSVDALRPEIVPEPFREWVADMAERMQCPPDFVAVTAIVVTGAVVGAGCGVRPKLKDDWLVIPNLWGGIVGRPSMLKTPAINDAMKPLARLEIEAKKNHDEAERTVEAETAAYEAKKAVIRERMRKAVDEQAMEEAKKALLLIQQPDAPGWRRYKTNDATIEKMGELLSQNPRGLLLFRDELVGLLATWDKEGHETDRAFFLESWNGYGSITTDRIGRGTTHTDNLCISVFGGIQPAKLIGYLYRAMRGHENDGLMQRIQMLVYPDELTSWILVDRYPDTTAKNRAFQVIEKLAGMDFTQHGATLLEGERTPFFRFDTQAQALFYEWWTELERDKLRSNRESIMLEHLGKYRSLMPTLALLFHLIEIADGKATAEITLRSATLAAAWCEYLESHAKRIYGMVSNLAPRAAVNLCRKIGNGALLGRFSVRDVYRKGWELLDDREVVQDACEILVSKGWLREVTAIPETGRPPSPTYVINPRAKAKGSS